MKQKEITINGKTYPVVFTIKTMMGFEDITGKKFFSVNFEFVGDKVALVFASIIAADEKAEIQMDEMLNGDNLNALNDIGNAFNTINEMAEEFFRIPKVEPKPEPEAKPKNGDDPKN